METPECLPDGKHPVRPEGSTPMPMIARLTGPFIELSQRTNVPVTITMIANVRPKPGDRQALYETGTDNDSDRCDAGEGKYRKGRCAFFS